MILDDFAGKYPVNKVFNFEFYKFILPASLQNGGTLLTVNDVKFGNAGHFSDTSTKPSTVTGIDIVGGGDPLYVGDRVSLIHAKNSMTGTISNDGEIITGRKGVTLLYDFLLTQSDKDLYATVQNGPVRPTPPDPTPEPKPDPAPEPKPDPDPAPTPRINPQVKALSEGRLAGLGFVNQGSDLIAMKSYAAAARKDEGVSAFFLSEGGKSRYNTGSHVDSEGYTIIAGLASNADTDWGRLVSGIFYEAGWGNYDSYNSFTTMASVRDKGNISYQGGGVIARLDTDGSAKGRIYYEGSFRAGRLKTDFKSSDLFSSDGVIAEYDSRVGYFGAHLGTGYIMTLNDHANVDIYCKYLWTRIGSDDVIVAGDPIAFQATHSQRLRAGARYNHDVVVRGYALTPFIGGAIEYEFDGKAKATSHAAGLSVAIDAPELTGVTAIGEIGVSFKTAAESRLSLDAGFQAYAGQRQGASGNLAMKMRF